MRGLAEINHLRERYYTDFTKFAADCLLIRTKTGGVKPFILNRVQRDFVARFEAQMHQKRRARFIILKSRQQGLSTLIEALMYWRTIYNFGYKGLVLTHLDSATRELFEMTRRYHNGIPALMRPESRTASAHELSFGGLDSAIKTATAGSPNAGHGSTYQALHWSEVSRSRNQSEMVAGVLQTIPDGDGTMVFLESTANGYGDYFAETWQAAVRSENDFEPVFYPWFWSEDYWRDPQGYEFTPEEREYQALYGITDGQLAWRQDTIKNKMEGSSEARLSRFAEQYPSNPQEAFRSTEGSLVSAANVETAMMAEHEPVGAVVMGVDPARQGKDATGVVVRQGRKVLYVGRWRIPDTMGVAGRVARLINEYKPDAVFVDAIGVGAGVYDRLRELGFDNVQQALVSARAERVEAYVNKRAEMWAHMAHWLDDGADIPNSAVLREDLLMVGFSEDSNNRLRLNKKKDLKHSPDLGDALALTFFAPVNQYTSESPKRKSYGGQTTIRV